MIKETLNSSVRKLFKMSDEFDKNLYLELISEQCTVITWKSKEKSIP